MNQSVTFRPLARQDLLDQMMYLEEQADEETAVRYYDAVLASCLLLAGQPLSGKVFETRVWPIEGLR